MADRSAYGGQAVIEGVMIRGKTRVATACRVKDGSIVVRHDDADPMTQRAPWLRLAFLRGTPALIDSLRLGYKTLMWSADVAMEGEDQPQIKPSQTYAAMAVAMLIGIGVFVLLPTYLLKWVFPGAEDAAAQLARSHNWWTQLTPTLPGLLQNLAEGLLRILMLVGYILFISRMKDIRRVFAYHGAEHKVVNAWEAGAEMTVAGAKPYSRIHPRCGTSFIFLVFIVGILLHAVVGWPVAWLRVIIRLLMLIPVAGVAYELIRLAGRYRNSLLLKILVWPGMLLQQLTTAEPEDDQIEVALHSMKSVLIEEGVLPPDPEMAPEPTVAPQLPPAGEAAPA
ncbi:MAG TPA: DUF1385 domain-containing protein [Armatimonadota bacterium]|jgi:uncharacterized protein YqhQ